NLVYLRTERLPQKVDTWGRRVFWEGTRIPKWSKGRRSLPEGSRMWNLVCEEVLRHPKGLVDVWLVLGNGLDVNYLKKVVKPEEKETPEVGPLLHLLDGLAANCAEAAVNLTIFGH